MPDVQNINLSKIIKRLEVIKSLISLEEEEEIAYFTVTVPRCTTKIIPTNLFPFLFQLALYLESFEPQLFSGF